jgi:hypothetical protein
VYSHARRERAGRELVIGEQHQESTEQSAIVRIVSDVEDANERVEYRLARLDRAERAPRRDVAEASRHRLDDLACGLEQSLRPARIILRRVPRESELDRHQREHLEQCVVGRQACRGNVGDR